MTENFESTRILAAFVWLGGVMVMVGGLYMAYLANEASGLDVAVAVLFRYALIGAAIMIAAKAAVAITYIADNTAALVEAERKKLSS